MTDPYWIDDDQGSTIQFSKTETDGTTTTIHMSVVKSDRLEQNTPVRQNNTITQNVTDNISAYVSVTPIVTYDAENAFAFDVSANEQVSFDFIRKNPQGTYYKSVNNELVETPLPDDTNPDDDRVWSNRHWIEQFSALINRWQALTDGCVMSYVPLDDTLQYAYSVNVFLRNLSYTLSINSNEVISGTVDVQIGSMTANAARAQDSDVSIEGYNEEKNFDEMTVTMSSSDGLASYVLFCKDLTVGNQSFDLNCISDYTLKGGPEQPFEVLTMNISKKRLSVVAPNLLDDIIPGRNRITINAMGTGQFIVTKCSTNSSTYKVIAYSIYEVYRSIPIGGPMYFGTNFNTTPFGMIQTILFTNNRVGTGSNISPVYITQDRLRYAYFKKNDNWAKDFDCSFGNNSSAWYVISVCALKLNCKVWFSDNYAYVIDPTITETMLANPGSAIVTNIGGYKSHIPKLYLNTSDPYPLTITDAETAFVQSVCDTTSLGDEGAETICNSVVVQFSPDRDSRYVTVDSRKDYTELTKGGYSLGVTATGVERALIKNVDTYRYVADVTQYSAIAQSQSRYGVKGVVYKIPEIGVTDANDIAVKVAESYCDSEQSVGFKLKEMHIDEEEGVLRKYWQKYFPTFTQVDEIHDYSNDLVISNKSNFLCADTTSFKVTSTNYDDDQYIQVPKGASVRVTPYDGVLWKCGVGCYTGDDTVPTGFSQYLRVYRESDDTDITSKTRITVIDNTFYQNMTFQTIDIQVDEDCYMIMYGVGYVLLTLTYAVGAKLHFQLHDKRQTMPNKLILSTFEHHFPEGTTKYWFGIMKPTDITQNTSEISNAIYNQ